jgi:hypothetical protein
MNGRNTIQVSEANAHFYIPSIVLKPFGYTGMPKLYSKKEVENALLKIIRNVAERIDQRNDETVRNWLNDPNLRNLLDTYAKTKS